MHRLLPLLLIAASVLVACGDTAPDPAEMDNTGSGWGHDTPQDVTPTGVPVEPTTPPTSEPPGYAEPWIHITNCGYHTLLIKQGMNDPRDLWIELIPPEDAEMWAWSTRGELELEPGEHGLPTGEVLIVVSPCEE